MFLVFGERGLGGEREEGRVGEWVESDLVILERRIGKRVRYERIGVQTDLDNLCILW